MEPIRTQHPQLLYEAKVLRHMRGGLGIPEVTWVGTEGESNIMVMDLLGPSLEDLFNFCNRRFGLKVCLAVFSPLDRTTCDIRTFLALYRIVEIA
mmetsp:Transcript_39521/g.105030  ORF Transcript_39521/g.105030 Transcript_39521/m.105030 type:complete len:95 (+) Transcript_39521:523-807(+)